MCVRLYRVFADCVTVSSRECLAPLVVVSLYVQVAECYKGRMVLGGSRKVSFGRRIREDPYLRIQSELYTHSEVVSSPK